MKTCVILVILAAAALMAEAGGRGGKGGRGGGKGGHMKKCGDLKFEFQVLMEHGQECKSEAEGVSGHEKWAKMGLCVLKKKEIMNGNKINRDKFIETMGKLLPGDDEGEKGREIGTRVADKCFTDENTGSLNTEDLETFDGLKKCVFTEMKQQCGWGKHGKPKEDDD